jgi:nuclear pore complex protein Nup133
MVSTRADLRSQMHTRSPQSLLSDSILAFMNQVDHAEEDDLVRQFFRTRVQHLDQLLGIVFATFRTALASSKKREDLSPWVLEANRIFIVSSTSASSRDCSHHCQTVLRAASQYRETDLYEVNRERPAIELWTASDVMIDAIESLYSATEQLIKDRTRDFGSVIDEPPSQAASPELRRKQVDQSTLKTQMTDLAAALCSNMEDKMRAASR